MEENSGSNSEVVESGALTPKLANLVDRSRKAIDASNFDYAINMMQAVLMEEPRYLDGRKMLRQAAIRKKESQPKRMMGGSGGSIGAMKIQPMVKKDPQGAINQLEKEVLASDPFNPQGNQLLFEAASKAEMPMTAGFALEILVKGNDENTKYKHQLGDYYLEQGFLKEAADVFGQIVAQDPRDMVAIKKEKDASARASMEQSNLTGDFRDNLRNKDEAAELEASAREGMTDEQREEQIAIFLAKYAEDQNDLNTVKGLAALYEQKEDFDQALAFYEWAHSLSDGDATLESKVVEVKERQRKRRLEELSVWLAANEGHPDYAKAKAEFDEFNKSHLDTQITDYREQVERNPTDNALRFKYGESLYEAGMHKEAIPELQRAQQSPSLRIGAMLMLGKCYEQRGMNDLAVDQLQKAAAELQIMDGTKKEIVYTLGLVQEKMGNAEQHLECMKQIYSVDYGYKDVAERVESSYS